MKKTNKKTRSTRKFLKPEYQKQLGRGLLGSRTHDGVNPPHSWAINRFRRLPPNRDKPIGRLHALTTQVKRYMAIFTFNSSGV
jgi:hypothetical protein